MNRVQDKICIVTGAASGMGRAHARLLVQEGAYVVVTDLNQSAGQAVAAELGDRGLFLRHDVSSEADWQAVIAATLDRFGGLDVLANNAGMMKMGTILDCTLEDYRKLSAVNDESVFLGCKYAIPEMEKRGGGSIINIASIAALHGESFNLAYTASKGAVTALTRSVAVFCRSRKNRIRCNSVHPGGVLTPMVAKLALQKDDVSEAEFEAFAAQLEHENIVCMPEDIASMVLFLASDESRYVNGAQLVVDNGEVITSPMSV